MLLGTQQDNMKFVVDLLDQLGSIEEFVYGRCPRPVTLKNGLTIGGGEVYPELNFTLPGMLVTTETMPDVCREYTQMITEAAQRAVELHAPGLVVEFELLPDLTLQPEWGAEITKIIRATLDKAQAEHGLIVGLRVTLNDIRSFELCAQAGADFLLVESTGGKEIHAISRQYGVIPAGDSACGFANTAIVLAEQHSVPRGWAALIRVMSVARSLVAFERGAVGPNKDCAYEGPYIKANTGCPISLEGAEAACAHLSPIGNIAKVVPDLWSNESVNNVRLLSAMAPTVSLEQLVYATRLMNVASARSHESARMLRDWWVDKLFRQSDDLPEDEAACTASMLPTLDPAKIQVTEYGL